MLAGGAANAHQFSPTYPLLEPSYVDGVLETKMTLFNKRNDVEYYELGVFDSSWNPIPFIAENKIIHVKYLETKNITIYIRQVDSKKITYICTRSKILSVAGTQSLVSSRICSKIK